MSIPAVEAGRKWVGRYPILQPANRTGEMARARMRDVVARGKWMQLATSVRKLADTDACVVTCMHLPGDELSASDEQRPASLWRARDSANATRAQGATSTAGDGTPK